MLAQRVQEVPQFSRQLRQDAADAIDLQVHFDVFRELQLPLCCLADALGAEEVAGLEGRRLLPLNAEIDLPVLPLPPILVLDVVAVPRLEAPDSFELERVEREIGLVGLNHPRLGEERVQSCQRFVVLGNGQVVGVGAAESIVQHEGARFLIFEQINRKARLVGKSNFQARPALSEQLTELGRPLVDEGVVRVQGIEVDAKNGLADLLKRDAILSHSLLLDLHLLDGFGGSQQQLFLNQLLDVFLGAALHGSNFTEFELDVQGLRFILCGLLLLLKVGGQLVCHIDSGLREIADLLWSSRSLGRGSCNGIDQRRFLVVGKIHKLFLLELPLALVPTLLLLGLQLLQQALKAGTEIHDDIYPLNNNESVKPSKSALPPHCPLQQGPRTHYPTVLLGRATECVGLNGCPPLYSCWCLQLYNDYYSCNTTKFIIGGNYKYGQNSSQPETRDFGCRDGSGANGQQEGRGCGLGVVGISCETIGSIQQFIFENHMGNTIGGKVSKLKNKLAPGESAQQADPTIGIEFVCPNCEVKFAPNTLNSQVQSHLRLCVKNGKSKEYEKPLQSEELVPSKHEKVILNYDLQDYYYIKEPTDDTYTHFKWLKAPIKLIPPMILSLSPEQIENLSFQEKSAWFRYQMEKLRISWMKGADFMRIEKSNVLMSSLIEAKKVNMYKEVKIEFVGEKVSDAGGLLREWMHMVINEMFDESTGIFRLCNTDDTMYKLKWDEDIDEEFSSELLVLYGLILGKAIFEKIPISSYLDRTLLRQLSSRTASVQFYDIFGYDKELYRNYEFLLENEINEMGLDTYFSITKENSENATLELVELVEDGKDILVTDENKKMFVSLCIETLTKEKVHRSVDFIRKGLYKVVPEQLLKVFQPYEMEMLLYGVPYIDVKDWRANTDYKGEYSNGHKVVRWFWEVMETFDQEQLARLLKFSTGSSRTPIHGFKKLQSNRGNFSKFLVESSEFHKENPYPKGHTCFNRLELPKYHSKEQLRIHLSAIANNNLDGIFGLD